MTQEQLEALCRKWQRVLRLQDWDVKPRLVRQWEMQDQDNMGECFWRLSKKMAVIRVIDKIDYSPDIRWPYDAEEILVHELLHLHFAPFSATDKGSPEDIAQEQAIDAIARALVELSRAGGGDHGSQTQGD